VNALRRGVAALRSRLVEPLATCPGEEIKILEGTQAELDALPPEPLLCPLCKRNHFHGGRIRFIEVVRPDEVSP
jgi:hypothetical protein